MDDLIDISKASELLGVNTKTLRRWDNEGKLKAYRTIIVEYPDRLAR